MAGRARSNSCFALDIALTYHTANYAAMSDIIDEICTRMARYPHAEIEHDSSSITYYPPSPDGFIVRLVVRRAPQSERYFVYYAGCCQPEQNRDWSVFNFGWGLSTGCRVREFSRSGLVYRWITDISVFPASGWKPYCEWFRLSTALWQFWRRPTVEILRNELIGLDSGCGGGRHC